MAHWNILTDGVSGRVKASGEKVYYLKDHLGSTRAVIDDNGDIQESHDYYPFGLVMPGRRAVSDPPFTKELFTGKERDAETGLDYFGARYYDASIGRWLSVDPLAEYPSPYVYVGNRPLLFNDPTGMNSDSTTLRIDFETVHMTVNEFIAYINEELAKGAKEIEDIISAIPGIGPITVATVKSVAKDAIGQEPSGIDLAKAYGGGALDVALGGALGKGSKYIRGVSNKKLIQNKKR